jgi:hypothetical protein
MARWKPGAKPGTINQGERLGRSDGTQQVRAVEGAAAFIAAGNTYSLRSGRYGERELTPVTSGFYATARVLDNGEVVVDIDQHNDRMNGDRLANGNIDTQSLQTQVRGRVGEWINVGGVDTSSSNGERGLNRYGNSSAAALNGISIKVDVADQ